MSLKHRYELNSAYCPKDSLISVHCHINSFDTVFVVNAKEIRGCFLGTTIQGKLGLLFDYRVGGMRGSGFD
jgi:hypothetical protein